MNQTLKRLVSLVLVVIAFAMPQTTPCMEEKAQGNPSREFLLFQTLRTGEFIKEVGQISELNVHVLKYTAALSLLNQPTDEWLIVHEEYPCIMKKHKVEIFQLAICQVYSVDPEVCERFLKGVLIYRLQEGSDVGRVDLPIAALVNPLEGTFDLSQCGSTGKYLRISTGYRKGKKEKNAYNLEAWLAPRFLIEKEIKTTASYFQGIFPQWNDSAPVGIFWMSGMRDNLDRFDYLISETFDDFSQNNLYEKWKKSSRVGRGAGQCHAGGGIFHICFDSQ